MKDLNLMIKAVVAYIFHDVCRWFSCVLLLSIVLDFGIGVYLILKFGSDDLLFVSIALLFCVCCFIFKSVFEYLKPFL